MSCRARGNLGNWFAKITAPNHPEIDGKDLPCIWDFWKDGDQYRDQGFNAQLGKFASLVDGLTKEGFAVLRKRKKGTDPDVFEADGYIGIYRIADVETNNNNLRLRFVHRVCYLDR